MGVVAQRVRDLGEDGMRLTVRVENLGRDHAGVAQWPLTPDGTRYPLMVSGGCCARTRWCSPRPTPRRWTR